VCNECLYLAVRFAPLGVGALKYSDMAAGPILTPGFVGTKIAAVFCSANGFVFHVCGLLFYQLAVTLVWVLAISVIQSSH
jgi:hypothetical protein